VIVSQRRCTHCGSLHHDRRTCTISAEGAKGATEFHSRQASSRTPTRQPKQLVIHRSPEEPKKVVFPSSISVPISLAGPGAGSLPFGSMKQQPVGYNEQQPLPFPPQPPYGGGFQSFGGFQGSTYPYAPFSPMQPMMHPMDMNQGGMNMNQGGMGMNQGGINMNQGMNMNQQQYYNAIMSQAGNQPPPFSQMGFKSHKEYLHTLQQQLNAAHLGQQQVMGQQIPQGQAEDSSDDAARLLIMMGRKK